MASGKKIMLGIGIGCGVVVLLGGVGSFLAYRSCVNKVDRMKSEFHKEAATNPAAAFVTQAMKEGAAKGAQGKEGGLVGAIQGMAGAGVAMGVSMAAMQVIPSLPAGEQQAAKDVFKAFNEKAGRMGQPQFDAVSAMLDRYNKSVEPEQKAKSEALEKAVSPAEKMRLSQEMMRINPEVARRFVQDLKELTDSIK